MKFRSNPLTNEHIRLRVSKKLGNALFQLSALLYVRDTLNKPAILDARFNSPGDVKVLLRTGLFYEADFLLTRFQRSIIRTSAICKIVDKFWHFLEYLEFKTSLRLIPIRGKFSFWVEQDSWKILGDLQPPVGIFGYFQDFALVELVETSILERLQNSAAFPLVLNGNGASTVIHQRLGDYKLFPEIGIPGRRFLAASIDLLDAKSVLIVSDEPNEAYDRLNEWFASLEICVSTSSDQLEDFALLMQAESIIIANSTFSWWAAYLGTLRNANMKVVGPTPWRRDKAQSLLHTPAFLWVESNFDSI
jgi:hypothetical protein